LMQETLANSKLNKPLIMPPHLFNPISSKIAQRVKSAQVVRDVIVLNAM